MIVTAITVIVTAITVIVTAITVIVTAMLYLWNCYQHKLSNKLDSTSSSFLYSNVIPNNSCKQHNNKLSFANIL